MSVSIQSVARRRAAQAALAVVVLAGAMGCSQGILPGAPSPISIGGGGGRYNGTVIYRRARPAIYSVTESAQTLSLSLTMQGVNQIFGRFQSGESSGTLSGTVNGTLASGTFEATVLVSSAAQQAGARVTCDGRGQINGAFNGVTVTWGSGGIVYENCPGLEVTSNAQAVAVSPIPGELGNLANVVITILGGSTVMRSTCPGGVPGYPFTVEMAERAGIDVTFDPTFTAEDASRNPTVLDMPFIDLPGGGRRTYSVCSPASGTYQAFFNGTDANGNRVRVSSPVVTFAP